MKTLINIGYYTLITGISAVGLLVLSSLMPIPGHIAVKVVKSGSMEPQIPVGSVVVDKPEAAYGIGDVITFGADTKTQVPTTHRVVGITGSGANETFTVKGDANNAPDANPVPIASVHGKVVLTIPYLGYILAFAKTQMGFILLVAIPALLVCVEEVIKIYAEVKRMRGGSGRSQVLARVPLQQKPLRTSYHVVDLRIKRADPPAEPEPPEPEREVRRNRGMNFGTSLGATLAAILVVGTFVVSRSSGDTTALYSSAQITSDNVLAANIFRPDVLVDAPIVGPSLFQSLLVGGDTSITTDTSDGTSDATDTPPSDLPPTDPTSSDATSTQGTTSTSTEPVTPPSDPPADPPADQLSGTVIAPPTDTPPADNSQPTDTSSTENTNVTVDNNIENTPAPDATSDAPPAPPEAPADPAPASGE